MAQRLVRTFALALIGAIVFIACVPSAADAPVVADVAPIQPEPAAIASPTPTPTPVPAPSPTPLYAKLRIFVASESTDQVWVLDGKPGEPYALVGKIAVGKLPHQLGVSPDGKWVAVNNRMGDSTSIIDPFSMKRDRPPQGGKAASRDRVVAGRKDAVRRARARHVHRTLRSRDVEAAPAAHGRRAAARSHDRTQPAERAPGSLSRTRRRVTSCASTTSRRTRSRRSRSATSTTRTFTPDESEVWSKRVGLPRQAFGPDGHLRPGH